MSEPPPPPPPIPEPIAGPPPPPMPKYHAGPQRIQGPMPPNRIPTAQYQKPVFDPNIKGFEFKGNAKEYFRIWIVNLALTVLTLGLYSAWAKVRRERYFYQNTFLNGSCFQYLADPKRVLIGRLITSVFAVCYVLGQDFYPELHYPFLFILFLVLPFITVKALRFKFYNSAYRNIRFSFKGKMGWAYIIYFLLSYLAVPGTLWLLWPLARYFKAEFIVKNTKLGRHRFNFNTQVGQYFIILAVLAAIIMVTSVICFFSFFLVAILISVEESLVFLGIVPIVLSYLIVAAYMKTTLTNLTLNGLTIAGQSFRSTVKVHKVYWLYLTNTLLIFCTLGLAIPWARIRLTHYRAKNTFLRISDEFTKIEAQTSDDEGATGAELGETFDVDFGLDISI